MKNETNLKKGMKKMRNLKTQKGITLVALVITIVVLIILAGVLISLTLNNNGIVSRAKQAKTDYINAQEYEKEQINGIDAQIEGFVDGNGGGSTPTTKTTYTMGETVTLGEEEFWVIEDSGPSTSTVKLLAKLNVITTAGNANRYKQHASANTLRFDDDSNVYANSEIKTHVDAYKLAVEGRMGAGKTIEEARLMAGTNSAGEVQAILSSTLTNKTDIVYGPTRATLDYWLGSPVVGRTGSEWYVYGGLSSVTYRGVNIGNEFGLRPVLIVLKSNI